VIARGHALVVETDALKGEVEAIVNLATRTAPLIQGVGMAWKDNEAADRVETTVVTLLVLRGQCIPEDVDPTMPVVLMSASPAVAVAG